MIKTYVICILTFIATLAQADIPDPDPNMPKVAATTKLAVAQLPGEADADAALPQLGGLDPSKKFIYVNVQPYNIRKTPSFGPIDPSKPETDNRAGIALPGDTYQVLKIIPGTSGNKVMISYQGKPMWIYQPNSSRDMLYCKDKQCTDVAKDTLKVVPGTGSKPGAGGHQSGVPTLSESVLVTLPDGGKCVQRPDPAKRMIYRSQRSSVTQGFINFMLPMALEIQEATGMPASVTIAQAALESGWGQSRLATQHNAFFGHTCTGSRYHIDWNSSIGDLHLDADCDVPMQQPASGKYLSFQSVADSIYAYAYNVLKDPAQARTYSTIRTAVGKAHPPEAADWKSVVAGLQRYATAPNYRSALQDIFAVNKLDQYDQLRLCARETASPSAPTPPTGSH